MADQPKPPESDVVITYARNFEHAVEIHRLLLLVLGEEIAKRGGHVDAEKSLIEVKRVVDDEVAIIALKDNVLIGSIGWVRQTWWFSHDRFLADRWSAVLPEFQHEGILDRMMAESILFANELDRKLVHHGKLREMKNGVGLMFPRLYTPSIHHDTATVGSA